MNSLPGGSMDLRDRQLSEVDSPAAWRRVGCAVAVCTIGSVGTWSMPVALPFVQTDFGITRANASLPYTLAMMGFAFGGVAMGRLCDRFGVAVAIMLGRRRLCRCVAGSYPAYVCADACVHWLWCLGDLRAAVGRHVAVVRAPSRDRDQ